MMKNKFIIFYILFLAALPSWSQDKQATGYLVLPDSGSWNIEINDSLIIPSSTKIISLPSGDYRLMFAPINNKNWQTRAEIQEITILPAETLQVSFQSRKFEKDFLLSQKKAGTPSTLEIPRISSQQSRLRKYLRPGLVVTAVATNWASFYLKRKADDYYADYQKTSDISKLNRYYKKAADFDIYSSVLLGISATALATYFYLMIFD